MLVALAFTAKFYTLDPTNPAIYVPAHTFLGWFILAYLGNRFALIKK